MGTSTYTFIVTGEHTINAFAFFDGIFPPGGHVGAHGHGYEEMLYVLEGELTVYCGDERNLLGKNTALTISAWSAHKLHNYSGKPVRIVVTTSPAELEKQFEEIGHRVSDRDSPPPNLPKEEQERIAKLMPLSSERIWRGSCRPTRSPTSYQPINLHEANAMTQGGLAIEGIHHIKLPVSDLERSLSFYSKLLGLRPIPELEHRHAADGSLYAHICDVPGLGTKLELRLNPGQAEKQRKFDPITIAVADRAMLRRWTARLDELGIRHSDEIVAIRAWLVTFDDPDQHRLRFYTLESHGPELKPDEDNPWLKN